MNIVKQYINIVIKDIDLKKLKNKILQIFYLSYKYYFNMRIISNKNLVLFKKFYNLIQKKFVTKII